MCKFNGKFWLFNFVGMEIFGRLVRLVGIVKILLRYIFSGLLIFFLIGNVVDGVVGVKMVFIFLKVV